MMLTYTEIFQHSVSASQNCYSKVFINNPGLLSQFFQKGLSSQCSAHSALSSAPSVYPLLSVLPGWPCWLEIVQSSCSVVSDSLWPHWKRPWCWERLKAGGEGDNRGRDGWMASLTPSTWVWASSGNWLMDREAWHAAVHGVTLR